MYILGIESSCDETAVALIERGEHNRVLDERIKSQVSIHARYGGVVPEIASRNHYEVIDLLTQDVLKNTGLAMEDIGLIALTRGPGLLGALLVGLSFAKGLAYANKIPLVGVDHIKGHIESAFIENPDIQYPLLALVVSGGHTTLFYQENKFHTEIIAKTRDDAVGEVMDKVAKYFRLGYPGGPILDKMYAGGDNKKYTFTRPRMSDGSNDFSFSGYKTAVIRHREVRDISLPPLPGEDPAFDRILNDIVSSFLLSVVKYLLSKTRKAVDQMNIKSLILSGGVSRNTLLRETFQKEFSAPDAAATQGGGLATQGGGLATQGGSPTTQEKPPVKLYMPAPRFCTDNAAMIAWLGYEMYKAHPDADYFDPTLTAYSRASFKSKGGKHR
ncbi:MAG: tRNA (adenosine(37)-N6)-threonylcarbamoyltransferase complex transferase subunit TsaD [bacterium]|nr:tRNA (adenosine(37)-N6)-threonylcarbamoyltransferase complex transferase subunit TsaD [bacterium]